MIQIQIEAEFAKVIEEKAWAHRQFASGGTKKVLIIESEGWSGIILKETNAPYEGYLECPPSKQIRSVYFSHKNLTNVVSKIDDILNGGFIIERLKINL